MADETKATGGTNVPNDPAAPRVGDLVVLYQGGEAKVTAVPKPALPISDAHHVRAFRVHLGGDDEATVIQKGPDGVWRELNFPIS